MKFTKIILILTVLFVTLIASVQIMYCAEQSIEFISHVPKKLTIATASSKSIALDRLLYAALKDINYQVSFTTTNSLHQGYAFANSGERDGVFSSTPNMESTYKNLRKVPVPIDYSIITMFVRDDSNIKVENWEDLAGLSVGILTQRIYIEYKIPQETTRFEKETTRALMEGLSNGDYDIAIIVLRSSETIITPDNIVHLVGMDVFPEYLYLNVNNEHLIPEITEAIERIFEDGRGDKILNDIPIPEMFNKKTVLHIMSSSMEIDREDEFSTKLRDSFANDHTIEWYTIELNARRFSGDTNRLTHFASLLRKDCVSRNVAAIIVSGANAMDFLKDYYFLFFRNVPVLFYGIDEQYESTLGEYKPYFTGVVEQLSAYDTVHGMLEILDGTDHSIDHIYVVNDFSTEGLSYRTAIEKQLYPFTDEIKIEYSKDIDRDSLLDRIKELKENSIVFFGSYFTDSNGQYYSLSEMRRILESECQVPIISLYSTNLTYNALGGKCLDYIKNAEIIAGMLDNVFKGVPVSEIPKTNSVSYNRWVFDYERMNEWNIDEKDLPEYSEILNRQPSIWESEPEFAISMMILLLVFVTFVILTQVYRYKDNILKRKLKEALSSAEEASSMKSSFLANMSHEIRTPMNGIIGFSELALEDEIPLKTQDYLGKIKSSSEWLLQIINDILDISKIESGKIELENIPFDIHEIFRLCHIITMPRAKEKGITLLCHSEPSIDKWLIGDPMRLRQALLNLLSNAVKFTNEGVVKLMSTVVKTEEDRITLYFEVNDSGIGMTQEQVDKIFEPFMQADNSTTRKYGGTGLGLTITKSIVEMMGGELKLESTPKVGSKFSFQLTFKTTDTPEESSNDMNFAGLTRKPVFEGKILVCEDNLLNQQVIQEHLSRVGIETVIASNGLEGVEMVRQNMESGQTPFDIIFMDIHMPVMDGLEAAEKLKNMGNKIPVIALTANIMSTDKEIYYNCGMADCLPKPYTTQELWNCLFKYIMPIKVIEEKNEDNQVIENQNKKIQYSFAKENQKTFQELSDALNSGDITLAHRIAHTLGSVAGLIGKTMLQDIARSVEKSLASGKNNVKDEQLKALELELNLTLSELAPILAEFSHKTAPKDKVYDDHARELLCKLDSLLKSNSFDCIDLINDLESIPGTETLIEQIDDFDFSSARKTLDNLRCNLEADNS